MYEIQHFCTVITVQEHISAIYNVYYIYREEGGYEGRKERKSISSQHYWMLHSRPSQIKVLIEGITTMLNISDYGWVEIGFSGKWGIPAVLRVHSSLCLGIALAGFEIIYGAGDRTHVGSLHGKCFFRCILSSPGPELVSGGVQLPWPYAWQVF